MNLHKTDWNKFRTFYHVVKAASFTRAAKNLHTSQPSLSRCIASLEQSLNMRLLERFSRGVVPTEEGKALLATVDAMLNVFLRYGEKVNTNEPPQGLLKISLPPHLPSLKISQYTEEFTILYPHMRLAFVEGSNDVGFSPYQADVAIQEFDEKAKNLEQIYLTTSSIGFYASARYLAQNSTPQIPEDLNTHRLIALGASDPLPSWGVNRVLDVEMAQGQQRTPTLCFHSLSQMTQAVQRGLGIASLPEEYAIESSLVRILPKIAPLPLDLYYVYPSHHRGTKRVTAYGEFLTSKLRGENSSKTKRKIEKTQDLFRLESPCHPSYAHKTGDGLSTF